jgi:hypothetical protein
MKWLIQRHQESHGREATGSFEEAIRLAAANCRTRGERCLILALPRKVRVAEVDQQGLQWKSPQWFEASHLLSPEHPEWTRMWLSLNRTTGSYSDFNPESRERWQYTVTFWKNRTAIGSLSPLRVLVHEFRHRDRAPECQPLRGASRSYGRIVLHLSASHRYSGNWNHPLPEGALV